MNIKCPKCTHTFKHVDVDLSKGPIGIKCPKCNAKLKVNRKAAQPSRLRRVKRLRAGIDWGTDSSKFAAVIECDGHDPDYMTQVMKSNLFASENSKTIVMSPSAALNSGNKEVRLKRIMIDDHNAPFWSGNRTDILLPLGEGVCFSICAILGTLMEAIQGKGYLLTSSTELDMAFSFPNWVNHDDYGGQRAANNYHQAITVAINLFMRGINNPTLPVAGKPFELAKISSMVSDVRESQNIYLKKDIDIAIDKMPMSTHKLDDVQQPHIWRYLVESCAAGMAYLGHIPLEEPPGLPGLAKLLVVDIGAGSTDVGYMLKSVSRGGTGNLWYFSPAPAHNIAGDNLRDMLRKIMTVEFGRAVSNNEAEEYKVNQADKWKDKQVAQDWRKAISNSIRDYIQLVQDKKWLERNLRLQVVVTGGSGLVRGLGQDIRAGISEGLRSRKLNDPRIYENVGIFSKSNPLWKLPDVDYARCAVAIGCVDDSNKALKYQERLQ